MTRRFSWPFWTLAVAAVAGLPYGVPGLAERWEFSREAIAAGEWWRVLTGHWVHWSLNHFAWDLAMLLPLAAISWFWGRGRTLVLLTASSLAISAAVVWGLPEMQFYRGLSGLDSALFVHLACTASDRFKRQGDRWGSGAALLALSLFAGKILLEVLTGSTLFADSATFEPVPLAHLVGGLVAWALQPWFGRADRALAPWGNGEMDRSAGAGLSAASTAGGK